ncbi:MAG TPA: hypothetical protein IAA76_06025 [Candidatus Ornithospirochaeta stercorigallinarum]|nr:hypothetical protein [Candidatus Ornithospirochaeta stercorigallinarum]
MEKILSGEDELSIKILNKIAAYFFIPLDLLIDDEKNLPELETLELDEDLLSVQRNDVAKDIERMKQKHYISRNWKMIGYKKRLGDVRKYRLGSDGLTYDIYDPLQVKYHDDLEHQQRE